MRRAEAMSEQRREEHRVFVTWRKQVEELESGSGCYLCVRQRDKITMPRMPKLGAVMSLL